MRLHSGFCWKKHVALMSPSGVHASLAAPHDPHIAADSLDTCQSSTAQCLRWLRQWAPATVCGKPMIRRACHKRENHGISVNAGPYLQRVRGNNENIRAALH